VVPLFPADELWTALCSGDLQALVYCEGRRDFDPIPLSAAEFFYADKDTVLASCQIEIREEDTRRPVRWRRRIPVPHWLYVTRVSLAKCRAELAEAKPAASTQPRGTPTSDAAFANFIEKFTGPRTESALTAAVKHAGLNVTRARIRAALPPDRRRGRLNKSPK
jgi:hypothetical protein